jgi:hypothetical protein
LEPKFTPLNFLRHHHEDVEGLGKRSSLPAIVGEISYETYLWACKRQKHMWGLLFEHPKATGNIGPIVQYPIEKMDLTVVHDSKKLGFLMSNKHSDLVEDMLSMAAASLKSLTFENRQERLAREMLEKVPLYKLKHIKIVHNCKDEHKALPHKLNAPGLQHLEIVAPFGLENTMKWTFVQSLQSLKITLGNGVDQLNDYWLSYRVMGDLYYQFNGATIQELSYHVKTPNNSFALLEFHENEYPSLQKLETSNCNIELFGQYDLTFITATFSPKCVQFKHSHLSGNNDGLCFPGAVFRSQRINLELDINALLQDPLEYTLENYQILRAGWKTLTLKYHESLRIPQKMKEFFPSDAIFVPLK